MTPIKLLLKRLDPLVLPPGTSCPPSLSRKQRACEVSRRKRWQYNCDLRAQHSRLTRPVFCTKRSVSVTPRQTVSVVAAGGVGCGERAAFSVSPCPFAVGKIACGAGGLEEKMPRRKSTRLGYDAWLNSKCPNNTPVRMAAFVLRPKSLCPHVRPPPAAHPLSALKLETLARPPAPQSPQHAIGPGG